MLSAAVSTNAAISNSVKERDDEEMGMGRNGEEDDSASEVSGRVVIYKLQLAI